jgi:peptidoglycan/xylan/chitin deacetylase (PgdA/CDA1 family)
MSFVVKGLFKWFLVCLYHMRMLQITARYIDKYQPKKRSDGKHSAFPFIEKRRSRNVQILVYHRVNDEMDPFFPATPTIAFKRHMEYLAENFNVCPLAEGVERLKTNDVPERAVVVTFDDGYRDNYLHAFPTLQRLSIPATIFLATGAIGSGEILWHDRVFSVFRRTRCVTLKDFGHPPRDYPLRSLRDKLFAQSDVLWYLRSISDGERERCINLLAEKLGTSGEMISSQLMLSWEEINTMCREGISFGSHTVNHPILSKLSREAAQQEIVESKKTIERHLSKSVETFAYPSGRREDFTEPVKALVREAGYSCGVSMIFGANEIGQDHFELRRGAPWEYDTPTFAAKLAWYKFVSRPLTA